MVLRFRFFVVFTIFMLFAFMHTGVVLADGPVGTGRGVSFDVTVVDETFMQAGDVGLSLWGVDKISNKTMLINLKARKALDGIIGDLPITCDVLGGDETKLIAQCTNSQNQDLSLFLLQQGYVHVDRAAVKGTIYEKPYVEAENVAFQNKRGVWEKDVQELLEDNQKSERYFAILTFVVITVFTLILCIIGLLVVRRFAGVIDVQNKTIDFAEKERELKKREKEVLASMIFSEIRENKDKIDAYVLIYEEGLKSLQDETKTPDYQIMGGDTFQKQPSLSRGVFDGNTHKLDLLGSQFASDLIHYYARIKTVPDYEEIKADENLQKVQDLFKTSIDSAEKLREMSIALSASFVEQGLVGEIHI